MFGWMDRSVFHSLQVTLKANNWNDWRSAFRPFSTLFFPPHFRCIHLRMWCDVDDCSNCYQSVCQLLVTLCLLPDQSSESEGEGGGKCLLQNTNTVIRGSCTHTGQQRASYNQVKVDDCATTVAAQVTYKELLSTQRQKLRYRSLRSLKSWGIDYYQFTRLDRWKSNHRLWFLVASKYNREVYLRKSEKY